MSARKVAAVLAVSAAVAAAVSAPAQAVGFQSFAAGKGRVLCMLVGREAPVPQKQLLCWTPSTGASVSLKPAAGRPQSRVRETLRGLHQAAPPLRSGRKWSLSWDGKQLLRCSGQATGVTCSNRQGHGFRVDARGIATY